MIDVPIQVKDALRDGRLRKNYRFNVLNSDGTTDFTIDNDTLVSESVSIDERMCSGDTIKFGLCEGSSLEFQYFNHENITDRQIQAFIDIDYGEDAPYSIPMGFFTVKNCSRQASTGIIKATCYNKLQSDYLDRKANQMLLDMNGDDPTKIMSVYDIQSQLLSEYAITERETIDYPVSPGIQRIVGIGGTSFGYYSPIAGKDTPFSSYEYRRVTGIVPEPTTEFSVYASSEYIQFEITNEYWYLDFIKGDIDVFASHLSDFCADMRRSYYTNMDRETARHQLAANAYFTIDVMIYDEQQQTFVRKWRYFLLDGSCVPSEALAEINQEIHKGRARITIHLIKKMGIWTGGGVAPEPTTDTSFIVSACKPFTYSYYEDYNPTTQVFYGLITKTLDPHITFSDGSLFNENITLSDLFQVREAVLTEAEKIEYTIGNLPEFTLRELVSADFETVAQFGQLDRETDLFSGVELNHSRLLPQETLYPDTALYPDGAAASATKSMYSKLWADEGNIHKWRYLIITYKGLDANNNEADFTLQRTINADGTDDYNCSDNWLFRNLVWTEQDIGTYADAMVAKMQDITWFPFEMWCSGLPYLETGDEIEIPLGEDSYTSYVLQRQLKGIQNLQDTYINGTLDIF